MHLSYLVSCVILQKDTCQSDVKNLNSTQNYLLHVVCVFVVVVAVFFLVSLLVMIIHNTRSIPETFSPDYTVTSWNFF